MRHVQAEIVEAYLLADDVPVGFTEIDLGMAGSSALSATLITRDL